MGRGVAPPNHYEGGRGRGRGSFREFLLEICIFLANYVLVYAFDLFSGSRRISRPR